MSYELICVLYATLFLLYIFTLYYLLKRDAISFRSGFLVAVMYFIWPGVIILLATGSLPLLSPFWATDLKTIHFTKSRLLWLWVYLISILFYVYISLFTLKKSTLPVDKITSVRKISLPYVTIFYVVIMLFFLYISGSFHGGQWYKSREHLLQTNSLAVFLPFLIWALRLLFIAKVIEIFAAKRTKNKGVFLAILTIVIVELIGGNRIFFVMLFLAFLLLWAYQKKWANIFIAGVISLPLAWVGIVYQEIRNTLYLGLPAIAQAFKLATGSELLHRLESLVLSATESVDLTVIFTIFGKVGHGIEPLWGSSYAKLLTWIIPRSLWPNKPYSISIIAGDAFGHGQVALVTTAIGEAAYNFYWLGPILLIFLILLAELLSRLIFSYRTVENRVALAVCGFLFFRMPYSDMAITLIILSIIYIFVNSMTNSQRGIYHLDFPAQIQEYDLHK